jgi:asparagine synthase (glutamine-hydrolysing)
MSGLCGWFAPHAPGPADAIDAMAGALSRHDAGRPEIAALPFGAIAAAGPGAQAIVSGDGAALLGITGRPCFRDRALAEIARSEGNAAALARAYERHGEGVAAALAGSYAFAILDAGRRQALLAVDRLGTRPLCYESRAEVLAFGSLLTALRAFWEAPAEIDPQAIYDYVHFHMVPSPCTVYLRTQRLSPGTYLAWRRGHGGVRRHWVASYAENRTSPFPELKQRFRSLMRESVHAAAGEGRVGAFLSGGTDSSTIAGMLAEATGAAPCTYSIGFDADGYDEMRYSRIAARHFAARHHEYYVTPDDVAAAVPAIAAVHDQPYGNASAVPAYYCAKLARDDGIDVLLGGDGGDELFGGNDRYAKQYLYSLYGDLPLFLRRALLDPLASLAPSTGITGQIQRYMRNASLPMPERYDNHNLLRHFGPRQIFSCDLLDAVDVDRPAALLSQAYRAGRAESLINRMLALDLQFTLADNDLPKVSRSCELCGIEARFPMLDDALVEFAAQLPPRYKLKGTRLRWFFKEALKDYLPREIIAKTKHGFGLPFGVWLQRRGRMRDMALDSLTALKRRGIVRPAFIDELVREHSKSHPGYYGTMIWVLLMLEHWFVAHRDADPFRPGVRQHTQIHDAARAHAAPAMGEGLVS